MEPKLENVSYQKMCNCILELHKKKLKIFCKKWNKTAEEENSTDSFKTLYISLHIPKRIINMHVVIGHSCSTIFPYSNMKRRRGKEGGHVRMWFLSFDMADTASSWDPNSTSASPVDFPLGPTSMWTRTGFNGEKNYRATQKISHWHSQSSQPPRLTQASYSSLEKMTLNEVETALYEGQNTPNVIYIDNMI